MIKVYENGKFVSDFMKMSIVAVSLAILSQIHIYILRPNFEISIAIILFPIALYYFQGFNITYTALLTSAAIYITRTLLAIFSKDNIGVLPLTYFPEIFFYIIYSMLFYELTRKDDKRFFIKLLMCDYVGKFVETSLANPSSLFRIDTHLWLILMILCRCAISSFVVYIISSYKTILLAEQHEEKYRKLLVFSSQLRSEAFWMEKNMHYIEKTMTEAYKLFENINKSKGKEDSCEAWANSALTIAKDIHEIKKEYALVVRGVREITKGQFDNEGMYLKDMLNILDKSLREEAREKNKGVEIIFRYSNNFYTTKHYYLMSIFRNIVNNAMDAFQDGEVGNKIIFTQSEQDDKLYFTIKDNGCGIEEDDVKYIFSPGYSTKINYSTGEINRGIGLSLVKEIIEDILQGSIDVKSIINKGTEFKIILSKEVIK